METLRITEAEATRPTAQVRVLKCCCFSEIACRGSLFLLLALVELTLLSRLFMLLPVLLRLCIAVVSASAIVTLVHRCCIEKIRWSENLLALLGIIRKSQGLSGLLGIVGIRLTMHS
jgi:hypothetical protein